MAYRYSYSQSRMKPPFWIVKDGRRHMAEVWHEDDARLLVRALEAEVERRKMIQGFVIEDIA